MADSPDRYEAYYTDKLWSLLPEIYRALDPTSAGGSGPLRELVARIGAQAAVLRRSIDRMWEDQSIESCDDWVIPYIADLLATNLVSSLDARGQRLDVAKTIYYRRRKGTIPLLEELAADITGWDARVVELFRRLGRARHGLDPAFGWPLEVTALDANGQTVPSLQAAEGLIGRTTRTLMGGHADLRDAYGASRAGTAFDELFHTADVRVGRGKTGWYDIPRLGVFLWRLESVPVDGVTPVAYQGCPDSYTFDPTGREIPLFASPLRAFDAAWVSRAEHQLPTPIDQHLLQVALAELYAAVDSTGIEPTLVPNALRLYEDAVSLAALVTVERISADPRDRQGKYFIDPAVGRIYAAHDLPPPPEQLLVGYRYGFLSSIGAGGYDRRVRGQSPALVQPVIPVSGGFDSLTAAATGVSSGTVQIDDSLTYGSAPDLTITDSLVLRADNLRRPLVRLAPSPPGPTQWTFTGTLGADQKGSTLVLDGLFLSGGDVVLAGDFDQVTLSTSTLDPGSWDAGSAAFALAADGQPLVPAHLIITGSVRSLVIDRCIVGPVRTAPATATTLAGNVEAVTLTDSIVQAVDPGDQALAIATGLTTMKGCTVLGQASLHQLEATAAIFSDVVTVTDYQQGCVRFSAFPTGSTVPRQYQCVTLDPAQELFTSTAFGDPHYAQLLASVDPSVGAGAEDGSEMGAFSRDKNPIKERSLLIKYQEFMPIGLAPVIIHVT